MPAYDWIYDCRNQFFAAAPHTTAFVEATSSNHYIMLLPRELCLFIEILALGSFGTALRWRLGVTSLGSSLCHRESIPLSFRNTLYIYLF